MAKIALSGAMFGDDILTHIQVAGEIGYQGIELRGMGPLLSGSADDDFLRRIEHGLKNWKLFPITFATWLGCFALRASDQERENELERSADFFALARRLNIPNVRVNPSRLPSFEAEEQHWKTDSMWLGKVADMAKEYGVSIYMEMHHGTLADTFDSALKLIDLVDRENVGVVFDPYNLFQMPSDYGITAIQALHRVIVNVHVKDIVSLLDNTYPYAFEYEAFVPHAGRFIPVQPQKNPRKKRFFANRLINQGAIDWYHVLSALRSVGYTGYLTVESTSGNDPNMFTGKELATHCFKELSGLMLAVEL